MANRSEVYSLKKDDGVIGSSAHGKHVQTIRVV